MFKFLAVTIFAFAITVEAALPRKVTLSQKIATSIRSQTANEYPETVQYLAEEEQFPEDEQILGEVDEGS